MIDYTDTTKLISDALHAAPTQVLLLLGNVPVTPESIASEFPTALGLAMIPLVVKPLDSLTDKILETFIVPRLEKAFPNCCNL